MEQILVSSYRYVWIGKTLKQFNALVIKKYLLSEFRILDENKKVTKWKRQKAFGNSFVPITEQVTQIIRSNLYF
jgi:hypothetical protein